VDRANEAEETTIAELGPSAEAVCGHPLESLQRLKAERLRELLKRRPGQKHYKRALRAYLDADGGLLRALMERLPLDTAF
jgi:hypothetical protein